MMGMPGSGKGHQCKILEGKGWTHISGGALLRVEARRKSRIGQLVRDCIAAGEIVPDDVITDLLRNALRSAGAQVVLDGYPRHKDQITILNSMIGQSSVVLPIYLSITEDVASRRVQQRVVCPLCDWVGDQNRDQVCGACCERMERRSDDIDPLVIERRLRLFSIDTMPTIREYARQGKLIVIEGTGAPSAVAQEIMMAITRLQGNIDYAPNVAAYRGFDND